MCPIQPHDNSTQNAQKKDNFWNINAFSESASTVLKISQKFAKIAAIWEIAQECRACLVGYTFH